MFSECRKFYFRDLHFRDLHTFGARVLSWGEVRKRGLLPVLHHHYRMLKKLTAFSRVLYAGNKHFLIYYILRTDLRQCFVALFCCIYIARKITMMTLSTGLHSNVHVKYTFNLKYTLNLIHL